MSVLFICLSIFALALLWARMERSTKEHISWATLTLMVMGLALCACSKGEPATTPASTPGVHWGVSYDRGYVFLEVEVRGDDHASKLELTVDKQVGNLDLVDNCVQVTSVSTGEVFTWFCAADAEHSTLLLMDPGTTPLTQGKYVLPIEFTLHRDMEDSSKDYWSTPKVTACKLLK